MKIGRPQMLLGMSVTLLARVAKCSKCHRSGIYGHFLGRKQISATTKAFLGGKHLWNKVQDYSTEQKTPATAMSAPSR